MKKALQIFWIAVLVLAAVGSCIWFFWLRDDAYTDDAYVEGNQVIVTPLIDGFVTHIYTDDTFLVKKGQLIALLDQTDAKIAFENAKDYLATTVRQVCQIFHQVSAFQSDIEVRKAELIKAKQDYQHRKIAIQRGGVSVENLEHAEAALKANLYRLKEVESLYQKELSMIQWDSIASNPLVKSASERLVEAWVTLYRCALYAPVDGLVAQRKVQVGTWYKAGDPLMSIIPLDQIWVNANYKETQMKKMRIGQRVEVTSDLYGDQVVYEGRIVGLPGGAGNAFSLLPPQNLSGNWIKIVQRLPVRVALDPAKIREFPLRLGLTMTARTHLGTGQGELVPETSCGAPYYATDIFIPETLGAKELAYEIVKGNVDPSLACYLDAPYLMKDFSSIALSCDGAE